MTRKDMGKHMNTPFIMGKYMNICVSYVHHNYPQRGRLSVINDCLLISVILAPPVLHSEPWSKWFITAGTEVTDGLKQVHFSPNLISLLSLLINHIDNNRVQCYIPKVWPFLRGDCWGVVIDYIRLFLISERSTFPRGNRHFFQVYIGLSWFQFFSQHLNLWTGKMPLYPVQTFFWIRHTYCNIWIATMGLCS
jgi:hypothetical protein